MKEFEIWSEGYAATGEYSSAYCYGKFMGETFDDACINSRQHCSLGLDTNSDGTYRRGNYRGDKIEGKDKENKVGNYSIWACQLFDNEADARKSFG
jgi:hypothetical protein